MANYFEDAINQKCSDNSVKNQRCALAVLLKFIGYSELKIRSDLVEQLMQKIRMQLRQTDKEKQILDLDILLHYIKAQIPLLDQNALAMQQRRAIAAALEMVFTVARFAEFHRTSLLSTSGDEYVGKFIRFLMKESAHCVGSSPGQLAENQTSQIKPKIYGGSAMLRNISKLIILTKQQEQQCNLLALAKHTHVKVDRFTHHSDTASTVRQYYNKKNNDEAREVFGQKEEELDNEADEEQERTLLEEIEHERSNVDKRIRSPVGVLSPGLNQLETPTEVIDDQKAQQDAANAEDVVRLLDPFNIVRVNKQSKSSLSPQEIVYNPEEYKQSFGRDMSSSFVLPYQDVPTLGNLGQTESSEVQTQSSADEEHEAPMIKEKETDDS
ncbi:MAG: hypothetical protein EZS28_020779 [Streblomastix strix]|uniref:Uncharacterized protein n=1 Tax=Streblomastix strix TaxID=222440 RepID=A0A5J4VML1_9EUKA|nr:MAG: hypothetical protein EZS28_020779 [Streblomastix strix]